MPKEITTVTTFSKFVALALFVALPFLGYKVGVEHGENNTYLTKQACRQYRQVAIEAATEVLPGLSPTTDNQ